MQTAHDQLHALMFDMRPIQSVKQRHRVKSSLFLRLRPAAVENTDSFLCASNIPPAVCVSGEPRSSFRCSMVENNTF
jgi:hypothetical protein